MKTWIEVLREADPLVMAIEFVVLCAFGMTLTVGMMLLAMAMGCL